MYSITFSRSAAKNLADLPKDIREQIAADIQGLAESPRPFPQSIKLTGDDLHRLKTGDYRTKYYINDKDKTIWIEDVLHRKDAYR